MKPSLVEILNALTGAKGWAEVFSRSHPHYKEAVGKFIEDLDQIALELRSCVYGNSEFTSRHGSTNETPLHQTVQCLKIARVSAKLITARRPEYTIPLKRFQREVKRAQTELIKKVRPGLPREEG